MRVTPKTDDELNPLLLPGDYDAEVWKSEEKKSQKGNDMIELGLRVFHDGGNVLLNDWLLDSVPAKLKHFCDSAGLTDLYESGELTAESCKGANVRVKVKVRKSDEYGDQNTVADYVARSVLPKNPKPKAIGTGLSGAQVAAINAAAEADDIPF